MEELKNAVELSREETVENGYRSVRFEYRLPNGQESFYVWGGLPEQEGPRTLKEAIEADKSELIPMVPGGTC